MLNFENKIINWIGLFLLWIGMWDLTDLIISIYIPENNSITKIIVYVVMILVAIFLIKMSNN